MFAWPILRPEVDMVLRTFRGVTGGDDGVLERLGMVYVGECVVCTAEGVVQFKLGEALGVSY